MKKSTSNYFLCALISLALYSNSFSQKVGIGSTQFVPVSTLDVKGNATIGGNYSATNAAPANGMLVEGFVGMGTTTPKANLQIGNCTTVTNSIPGGNGTALGFNIYNNAGVYNAIATGNRSGYWEIGNGGAFLKISNGTETADAALTTMNNSISALVNGYIGINSTSATTFLTVHHSGAETYGTVIETKTIGGTDGPRVSFEMYNAGSPKRWNHGIRNSATSYGIFEDGYTGGFGTERFTILAGGNVGINSTSPGAKLDVVGTGVTTIHIADGNQAAGKVLTSDASGYATWQTPAGGSANAWRIDGNGAVNTPAIVDGTNFLGTIDDIPLSFRVNNQKAGRIDDAKSNAFFGYEAANSTTGSSNTAIGNFALFTNAGGTHNAAVGANSIYYNLSGQDNTAVGFQALYNNSTGSQNIAIGSGALSGFPGNSCTNNLAIGMNAMALDQGSTNNIAIGNFSQGQNTTGTDNVGLGINTLASGSSGSRNTAIGTNALYSNSGLNDNTAIGYYSNSNNATGTRNTSVGSFALADGATVGAGGGSLNGSDNVAVGYKANWGASTSVSYSARNTALGSFALNTCNFAMDNVAVGYKALFTNNTLFGSGTSTFNVAVGNNALFTNATGANNTAVGYNTLYGSTGGNNTAIGYQAGYVGTALSTGANDTYIGYNAPATAAGSNNEIVLGNSSVTVLKCNVTTITALSDGRVKNNIRENIPGLEFIRLLRPISYHLDIDRQNAIKGIKDTSNWNGKYDVEKKQFSGFIAQEVETAAQKIGYDFSGLYKPQSKNDLYGIGYTDFVVPLVSAVKELDAKNSLLEAQIANLQKANLDLKNQLTEMTSISGSNTNKSNDERLKKAEAEIAELKRQINTIVNTQTSLK